MGEVPGTRESGPLYEGAFAMLADAEEGFDVGRTVELVPPSPGIEPERIEIVGLADQSAVLARPDEGVRTGALAERISRAVPGVEALDRATAVRSLTGVKPVQSSFQLVAALNVRKVYGSGQNEVVAPDHATITVGDDDITCYSRKQLIVSEVKGRDTAAVIVTHDARMTHYADRIVEIIDGVLQA